MPLQRAKDVVYEVVDGRAVLVDSEGQELITLNETGTAVWEGLDGAADVEALAERLAARFPAAPPDALCEDVERFLHQLRDEGLVVDV